MDIEIIEYRPSQQLQPYVELLWEGNFNIRKKPELTQKVVPNGFVELIIHNTDVHCHLTQENRWSFSPDYTIIGLYTQPYEVQFRNFVNVFGIRFKPEGIYNLFGIPASIFSERYEDMELVLGPAFREYCLALRESLSIEQRLRLTNHYLAEQLRKHHPEINYVNRAAELIRQAGRVYRIDKLPEMVYISLRQLEREFRDKVGTTPKRYLRIARINDVYRKLENGEKVDFTSLAFECGYSDQAHFIRDFKSFTGIKPSLYKKERNLFIVNPQK